MNLMMVFLIIFAGLVAGCIALYSLLYLITALSLDKNRHYSNIVVIIGVALLVLSCFFN